MGSDPIPGPLDPFVRWFETWKATLPRVKAAPRCSLLPTKHHQPNWQEAEGREAETREVA